MRTQTHYSKLIKSCLMIYSLNKHSSHLCTLLNIILHPLPSRTPGKKITLVTISLILEMPTRTETFKKSTFYALPAAWNSLTPYLKLQPNKLTFKWALKGTLEWEFFWLRFWILSYFIVSYAKIKRFWGKIFLIGPLGGELRLFRVVLRLRGMKNFFELGQNNILFFFHLWTLYMSQY